MGNKAALVTHFQQLGDGCAAIFSVVERAFVDVHANKFVGLLHVEVAGELHGVLKGFFAILESIADAIPQRVAAGQQERWPEFAPDGIASEGKGHASQVTPPFAQVGDTIEAYLPIGELALVNDQSCLVFAVEHAGDDLVERNDLSYAIRRIELQGQVGGRHGTGHSDLDFADLVGGNVSRGDYHRPIALADAASAGHDGVSVLNVWIGVERDRGDVVMPLERHAIQGLDVT